MIKKVYSTGAPIRNKLGPNIPSFFYIHSTEIYLYAINFHFILNKTEYTANLTISDDLLGVFWKLRVKEFGWQG